MDETIVEIIDRDYPGTPQGSRTNSTTFQNKSSVVVVDVKHCSNKMNIVLLLWRQIAEEEFDTCAKCEAAKINCSRDMWATNRQTEISGISRWEWEFIFWNPHIFPVPVFLSTSQIWQQQLGPTHVGPDLPPPEPGQRGRGGERSHSSAERTIFIPSCSFLQPALVLLSQLCPPRWDAIHPTGPPGRADQSLPVRGGQAGVVRMLRSYWDCLH